MQYRDINFNTSMISNKRNTNFCYLKDSFFPSETDGMYPNHDFAEKLPDGLSTGTNIVGIIGEDHVDFGGVNVKRKVIVQDGADIKMYVYGSSTLRATITGEIFAGGAFGDGKFRLLTQSGKIYVVSVLDASTPTLNNTLADIGGRALHAKFDGLYFWYVTVEGIYRQLGQGTPVKVFTNFNSDAHFVDFYDNLMILFNQDGKDIYVYFWDKLDNAVFERRVIVKNANLIAGGVVDGVLMLVKAIGVGTNAKEEEGRIIVTAYDGQNFKELSSVRSGDSVVTKTNRPSVSIGNGIMLFAVKDNYNALSQELFQDWLFKVKNNGEIETYGKSDTDNGEIELVKVNYDSYSISRKKTGVAPKLMDNSDSISAYGDYTGFSKTTYITNFINNTYNRHKLEHIMLSFEKLFNNEKLTVYYRNSEREAFTLLQTITAENVKDYSNQSKDMDTEYNDVTLGLPEQMYVFTKDDSEEPLPEYNEIQLKFVSENGFSVIQARMAYDYVTRNTV